MTPARIALVALFALANFATSRSVGAQPLPIFDAHLHYNDEAQQPFPLARVLAWFREHGVRTILATSRPNDGTRALVDAARRAPASAPRVVPFIRPYRNHDDRATWFRDPAIVALIEQELARDIDWRGIGEFHLFGAADAGTGVVKHIVDLAVARGLALHAHCDEAALEALYRHDPRVRIVWAHSGFTVPPKRLAAWLDRHPTLVGELSYRYDVTSDGRLDPAWRALFLRHRERFVLGSDTWINERWSQYGEILATYRGWLAQLPQDVAAAIAHGNGERLFAPRAP
ncbi:MAG: amidohydrolase family protein [Betaproteobacteria bacterium]